MTRRVPELGLEGAKQVLYDETRSNFLAFLDDVPDNEPFCYWWGPVNTHRDWEQGSGKKLWGINPDDIEGRMPEFLPDVHEIREDFADYLGEVQAVDAGVGVILEELERAGELDNTVIVISGDHGIPGFPRAKCNLYDIGTQVALAVRWPDKIKPGLVIDQFVNLMSLAPTFLEMAGEQVPQNMADSFLPLLLSTEAQSHNDKWQYVVTGRERHVAFVREGGLPYPSRAIRTKDYLYIRNFEPDRWPIGDPFGLEDPNLVDPEEIAALIIAQYTSKKPALGDIDPGPTKHWLMVNRGVPKVKPKFDLCFGKRPAEELYDLRTDPHHMINVAKENSYQEILNDLSGKLQQVLKEHDDPRVTEEVCKFEFSPYAGEVPDEWYQELQNDMSWSKAT